MAPRKATASPRGERRDKSRPSRGERFNLQMSRGGTYGVRLGKRILLLSLIFIDILLVAVSISITVSSATTTSTLLTAALPNRRHMCPIAANGFATFLSCCPCFL